jgi:hypothetical protein
MPLIAAHRRRKDRLGRHVDGRHHRHAAGGGGAYADPAPRHQRYRPFIPLNALKRIGAYVGQNPAFDSVDEVEKYMREFYASFGDPNANTDNPRASCPAETQPQDRDKPWVAAVMATHNPVQGP